MASSSQAIHATPIRVAIGGEDHVVFGTDDVGAVFSERRESREPVLETPGAAPRFQQAPGGTASVCLGGDDAKEIYDEREKRREGLLESLGCAHQAAGWSSSAQLQHGIAVVESRGPVGGADSVVLGEDSAAEVFARRQGERDAIGETPDVPHRFSQAPGGNSSITIDGSGLACVKPVRGSVGGDDHIVLGSDNLATTFCERRELHGALLETPTVPSRFQQAPGGNSQLHLNYDVSETNVTARGPVGGTDSVVLGGDETREIFILRKEERAAVFDTPGGKPRFCQAPGGDSSIVMGAGTVVATPTRGPIGGEDHVDLGREDTATMFLERRELRDTMLEIPVAGARFQQAPGGNSSLHLSHDVVQDITNSRGPVGGVDSVDLGKFESAAAFSCRQDERDAVVDTPGAPQRFPQAPGGNSSVCLGSAVGDVQSTPVRGPVGGEDNVVLGGFDSSTAFSLRCDRRDEKLETPGAAPRFQQAPGGNSTLRFSHDVSGDSPALTAGRPVGGADSVVLGAYDSRDIFQCRQSERDSLVDTPGAPQRFSQAPGGNSSIHIAPVEVGPATAAFTKGPVGGIDSLVLGVAEQRDAFDERHQMRNAVIDTPAAAPRFQQAPGGSASIYIGTEVSPAVVPVSRGPVGGSDMVVLGTEICQEIFDARQMERATVFATPDARPRFSQAPGGTTSICMGLEGAFDIAANGTDHHNGPVGSPERGQVGGDDHVVLGGDDYSAVLRERDAHHSALVSTPGPAPRFHQPPGGTSTVILGGHVLEPPASTKRQAPGGNASIVLGGNSVDPLDTFSETSANRFASGTNQNCGNVLTDRPTTQVRQTPGGTSTIVLGGDAHDPLDTFAQKVSANVFANGANQNCGNGLTGRPTTKVRHAPGGASTLRFGDENQDNMNVLPKFREDKETIKPVTVNEECGETATTLG
mmetsp:Transcript_34087/g.90884  ORF Transcript_34087/g.90884 Transcript_34087/m.90884 type:complete len:926 (-) Transcript_34087:249-3026(-)|eukprot:CAMPEP_0194482212 /NCGR_PEP_ID=MMETSP0253-20130528/4266_1 /TAXON_ID=2966 /ORGANISM="Noctiluca scintillans" /LENGTH=925 /DNA_ID=CAMNT_0039321737 /DNA_START=51 /DNA_END=2828 /DNA_ORIENTATION=-